MMKKILTALLLLCVAGTAVPAAVQVKTFEAALRREPKDGILVYFFGPDWDVRSTKMLKSFWENPEIRRACGDAAVLAVPVYQSPSDKEKSRVQDIRRGMKNPLIYSYPAVVMFDETGREYYIFQGDEILGEIETVAQTIREKIELFRRQKTAVKKAERVRGVEKAKLYGEAMTEGISDTALKTLKEDKTLNRVSFCVDPAAALKIIKESDPEGTTPYAKRFEYDIFAIITNKIHQDPDNPDAKMISPDEAYALAKKLAIEDETTYLPMQRQEILSACVAYLRRTSASDPRIKELNNVICKIDPESVWASVADETEKIWCGAEAPSKKKKRRKK